MAAKSIGGGPAPALLLVLSAATLMALIRFRRDPRLVPGVAAFSSHLGATAFVRRRFAGGRRDAAKRSNAAASGASARARSAAPT
jgi:hypothetical protein